MDKIKELDDTIPRSCDPAPGYEGNTHVEETQEVRRKINEIIRRLNATA